MQTYNSELQREIQEKYGHLPIVIASQTAADIFGWTSTYGKYNYIGDKKYENDDLRCIAEHLHERDRFIYKDDAYLMNILDGPSTLASLIEYCTTDWGLIALREIITYAKGTWWIKEIKARNLTFKLTSKIGEALEMDLVDSEFVERMWFRFNFKFDK